MQLGVVEERTDPTLVELVFGSIVDCLDRKVAIVGRGTKP
jgi:hypothetical protein